MKKRILFWTLLLFFTQSNWAKNVYQEPAEFIQQAFHGVSPEPKQLWLVGELKTRINKILGHPYSKLRVRYWLQGQRSVWILEEIGKEKPITTGFIIAGDKIEKTKVLIFRESRGWEVRHDFFTQQFFEARLKANSDKLNKSIDGISGATLSVRAVKKLARVALVLAQHINQPDNKQ